MASHPTNRPPGRPKTKYYTTLMGRIPQDLADRVKGYAAHHGQSISTLIREGLEWRIHESEGYSEFMSDRNETPLDELLSDTNREELDALLEDTENPALDEIVSDMKSAATAKVSDTNTYVATSAEESQYVESTPAFDPEKHRLGKLCPKQHEWGTTGQSLRTRNKAGFCLRCNAELNKSRRTATRQAMGATA